MQMIDDQAIIQQIAHTYLGGKYPIEKGQRNANLLVLAQHCSENSLPKESLIDYAVSHYEAPDFTRSEIERTIKSAYSRTQPKKEWQPNGINGTHYTKKADDNKHQTHFAELVKHLFTSDVEVEQPVPVIAFNGCIISTRGNITTIAGQSKSGKTGVIGAILSGCLDKEADTIGLNITTNDEGKGVVHIDTEQSEYDHHRLNRQILKRAGKEKEPDWYYSFHLRHLMPADLMEASGIILKEISAKHNGLHLMVVDGIAEYVISPNDDKESNSVVHFFTNLADQYQIPIILILHYNPGTEKGRGHLGSQLERKSESVISITKHQTEKSISLIQAVLMRNASVDDFGMIEFCYDKERGYHTYLQSATKQEVAERKREAKQEENRKLLKEYADEIFQGRSTIKHSELTTTLMQMTGKKERTARTHISDMVNYGIITKSALDSLYRRGNTAK